AGTDEAFRLELSSLKSEVDALQAELLLVRERQQPSSRVADSQRVLIRQDTAGELVYPVGRRTTIGRTPDNEIQIDAHNVSRHHAVLLANAEQCLVEDLNSTNGVLVNGRRVARQVLHDGDTVMVGKTEFRYRHRT